eukprot:scaffold116363_cov29-Cyclotella_meneghiniana.AAC.1
MAVQVKPWSNHPQSRDAVESGHGSNTLCLFKGRLVYAITPVLIFPRIMIDKAAEHCFVQWVKRMNAAAASFL